MMSSSLVVWAALTATAAPLPPADASGLRWKFEKGQTFYEEQTTTTVQTMTVMGTEVKQRVTTVFVLSWTPEKKDGDSWVLKMKVEAVKMDLDLGGTTITYDSTKPAAGDGGALKGFFGALVGAEFRATIEKGSTVTEVEGRDELIKKLGKANPESEALVRQVLSEDALKQLANPMLVSAPKRPLDKGDYWVKEERIDMGPVGGWTGRWQYTHAGKDGKLIKLKSEALKFEYQAPADSAPAAALPFRIGAGDLKSKNAAGTILFDPEKGRLHSAETGMEV
jgi:hypothetical protein